MKPHSGIWVRLKSGAKMQLNKNDLIKDGEKTFIVFCIMGSVVYVKPFVDVKDTPAYGLEEVLKHCRKIV